MSDARTKARVSRWAQEDKGPVFPVHRNVSQLSGLHRRGSETETRGEDSSHISESEGLWPGHTSLVKGERLRFQAANGGVSQCAKMTV